MSKIQTASQLLLTPSKFLKNSIVRSNLSWVPDDIYVSIVYWLTFKKKINLSEPHSFNEKLQWLKLHDRQALYTKMADKVQAKEIAKKALGEEYIIPTLGVWDKFDDINFDSLPEKFVLKTSHDSGGVKIIDKGKGYSLDKLKSFFDDHLRNNLYRSLREWQYKNITPKIIAETYIEDSITQELRDYKIFVFNGVARVIHIASNRQNANKETAFDFFDREFKHLDFKKGGHPNADTLPRKPDNLEKMFLFAEKVSTDIPFLRVDFFEANGNLYFGEFTFYPGSGFSPFEPTKWDAIFGEWLTLPK